MRLKLKTVFVLYFTVSLLGLIYALMQLGQRCDCTEHDAARDRTISRLRGELHSLREQMKKPEPTNPPKPALPPTIHVITPTYTRLVQKAELTRLSQTLLHVRQLHWILVEDSPHKTVLVSEFLVRSGLTYTHLHVPTPRESKLQEGDPSWLKPRGAEQRNEGLRWLRETAGGRQGAQLEEGVVYFADDDNTYSLQLFEEVGELWCMHTRSHTHSNNPFCPTFDTHSPSFYLFLLLSSSPLHCSCFDCISLSVLFLSGIGFNLMIILWPTEDLPFQTVPHSIYPSVILTHGTCTIGCLVALWLEWFSYCIKHEILKYCFAPDCGIKYAAVISALCFTLMHVPI
ncbi:galactosylgalactosylxylosylprotein 3-beta-glucuronosyltransferase 3 isoform X1 [Megalops cyprinoides]|uniref:galactosylgalactosylxylosylprotein 3-beta-glucuronosyltransferase 3 isoform X1 n=1 Tax=Megalops cyprinoides TaxID=118141 RepID=UPI0018653D0C|nr:galactosylgalactosylxylosylprotein 3-beta-glucuronosyltransferase 3 isoform X1 [Megalops cyprinoides]